MKIRLAKYAIKQALTVQKEGKGYSFVEILSPCPTNLKQDVKRAQEFIENQMEKEFPVKTSETTYTKKILSKDLPVISAKNHWIKYLM